MDMEGVRDSQTRIFTAGAPVLTSLNLTDLCLLPCIPLVNALTTLVLVSNHNSTRLFTYEEFSQALAATPSLTYLELDVSAVRAGVGAGADLPFIELPSLLYLQLYLHDLAPLSCIPNFYNHLLTPNLKDLVVLNSANITAARQISCLATFIRTHGQKLRNLTLLNVDLSHCLDADFIRAIPDIAAAQLTRSSEDAILKLLSEGVDSNQTLWPYLEFLDLDDFDVDVLRGFISSRLLCGRPLRQLSLPMGENSPHIPDDRLTWLRQYVEAEGHIRHSD
jgi:hypothetical protein